MSNSKTGLCVHLFHPKVDEFLLEYIRKIDFKFNMYITHTGNLTKDTIIQLNLIKSDKVLIQVENLGRDIRPFLCALHRMEQDGIEYIFKLHSKRGGTGLGDTWMNIFLDSLISRGEQMRRITQAMEIDREIALIGPSVLYKSSVTHGFGNESGVNLLANLFYGSDIIQEFGFFAGTMFAARLASYKKLASLFDPHHQSKSTQRSIIWEPEPLGANGLIPHAFERFFGAIPLLEGKKVGLINRDLQMSSYYCPGPTDKSDIAEALALMSGYFPAGTAPQYTSIVARGSNFEAVAELRGKQWHGVPAHNRPKFWKALKLPSDG